MEDLWLKKMCYTPKSSSLQDHARWLAIVELQELEAIILSLRGSLPSSKFQGIIKLTIN